MRWPLSLAAFLAYFIMSGLLAPIGLLVPALAERFALSPVAVAASFSWLTGGVLIGSLIALPLYRRIALRPVLAAVYVAMALTLLLASRAAGLEALALTLGLAGTLSGMGLAGAALLISALYRGDVRTSMLVVTDACFSIAGYVVAPLTGWLITRELGGQQVYLVLAVVSFFLCLLLVAPLPTITDTAEPAGDPSRPAPATPFAFWLLAVSLCGYTFGQQTLLIWWPGEVLADSGASSATVGTLIGRYWLGMFIAQLAVAIALLRIATRWMLLAAAWGTSLGASLVLYASELPASVRLLVWGIANLALLKVVLGFASAYLGGTHERTIPRLLFAATLGTALAPAGSAWFAQVTGSALPMGFAALLLTALGITSAVCVAKTDR
ncbi:MAG: MFS transporter [Pseudomonadota bacterium]